MSRWLVFFWLYTSQALGQAPPPPPETPAATPAPSPAAPVVSSTERRIFPYWARRAYDFEFEPIAGYRVTNTKTLAGLAKTSGIELGGRAAFHDIPLKRGNLGLNLDLRAGGAGGQVDVDIANAKGFGSEKSTVRIYRGFVEGGGGLYYKAFRWRLSGTRGVLKYEHEGYPLIQDITATNDFGLRPLRWFDAHMTTVYRHVFSENADDPLTVELDTWTHGHVAVPPWRLDVDAGPGVNFTQESFLDDIAAEGYARYFLLLLSRPALPYVGDFEGRVKYVLSTTDDGLGRYATLKLGEEDLAQPPGLTAPEDTLSMSTFFSARYGETRVGLWINWVIFDYRERDGRKSHLNRDNGVGAFYGYKL